MGDTSAHCRRSNDTTETVKQPATMDPFRGLPEGHYYRTWQLHGMKKWKKQIKASSRPAIRRFKRRSRSMTERFI